MPGGQRGFVWWAIGRGYRRGLDGRKVLLGAPGSGLHLPFTLRVTWDKSLVPRLLCPHVFKVFWTISKLYMTQVLGRVGWGCTALVGRRGKAVQPVADPGLRVGVRGAPPCVSWPSWVASPNLDMGQGGGGILTPPSSKRGLMSPWALYRALLWGRGHFLRGDWWGSQVPRTGYGGSWGWGEGVRGLEP